MDVPTSEVGYTSAMPKREDHEFNKGHVVALGGGNLKRAFESTIREFARRKSLLVPNSAITRTAVATLVQNNAFMPNC